MSEHHSLGRHPSLRELSAFLEDDLTEQRGPEVEAHLRTCPRCRRRRDEIASLVDEVRRRGFAWPTRQDVWTDIAAELERPRRSPWTRVGVALLAATIAGIVFLELDPGGRSSPAEHFRDQHSALVRELNSNSFSVPELARSTEATVLQAQREVSSGVNTLLAELETRPDDPLLADLIRRALQRKAKMARLARETTP